MSGVLSDGQRKIESGVCNTSMSLPEVNKSARLRLPVLLPSTGLYKGLRRPQAIVNRLLFQVRQRERAPGPGFDGARAGADETDRKSLFCRMVVLQGQRDVLQVALAFCAAGRLASRLDRREQEGNQNTNDRNDDQQLDERVKPLPSFAKTRLQLGEPEQLLIHCLPVTRWHGEATAAAWLTPQIAQRIIIAAATYAQSHKRSLAGTPAPNCVPQLKPTSAVSEVAHASG